MTFYSDRELAVGGAVIIRWHRYRHVDDIVRAFCSSDASPVGGALHDGIGAVANNDDH